MKTIALCRYATLVLTTALILAGCGTPPRSQSRQTSSVEPRRPPAPFLDKGEYSDRLGLAVQEALSNHLFSIPWIAVRDPDGSFWFVAERFESGSRFDRIHVHVARDGHVRASITPYQYGPSDWAILGRLFVDSQPEEELIARQIAKKLNSGA